MLHTSPRNVFFIVLAACMGMGTPALAAPVIGQPAPAFNAVDIEGNTVSLEQYKGKPVVLEWTNPECPFVVKHYETRNLQELQAYASDMDAVWIKINSGAPGKQGSLTAQEAKQSLIDHNSSPTAYILDPEGSIGKLYDAKTTPHMYVIDAQGVLVYNGAIDDKPTFDTADIEGARNYTREALDAVLEGKPVPNATTQPYGCSVKYKS